MHDDTQAIKTLLAAGLAVWKAGCRQYAIQNPDAWAAEREGLLSGAIVPRIEIDHGGTARIRVLGLSADRTEELLLCEYTLAVRDHMELM